MSVDELPILGITMGDAAGVGPEVTVMALAKDEIRRKARMVIIGDASVIEDAARIVGCPLPVRAIDEIRPEEIDDSAIWVLDLKNRPLDGLTRGKVDAGNGKAAFEYIDRAVTLALGNQIDAIVTAPLNKEAMHLATPRRWPISATSARTTSRCCSPRRACASRTSRRTAR
jgi:4-hydroxythreonine-4-phosphate dehydrogenase